MFFGRAFLTSLILFGAEAFAFWCPYAQYPRAIASLADVQPRIIKVEDIGPPDRRTEQQFGAEHNMTKGQVESRYAATGKLICGSYIQTAQLTWKHDLLTTAAHMFWQGYGATPCKVRVHPGDCRFETIVGGRKIVVGVEKSMGSGYDKCPTPPQQVDDWVVLKLKRPIAGVEPYRVDEGATVYKGKMVTAVGENAADFARIDQHGHRVPLKSIGKCAVHTVYSDFGVDDMFTSDCDSTQGDSGGSIISDDNNGPPTLIGITIGGTETASELNSAIRNGRPNECRYDDYKCATYHRPVTGEFLKAVERAADQEGSTQKSQAPSGISI